MIVHQSRHPWDKSVQSGVMIEPIPKDFLRRFGREGGKFITTARGDEVNGVVAVPVFESMLTLIDVRQYR
jgi:hypothetical protein